MALSNQSPIPAKLKPIPPPKPASPHHHSPLRQSVIDAQKQDSQCQEGREAIQPSSANIFTGGQRGKVPKEWNTKEEEGSSSNIKNPRKFSPVKHIPVLKPNLPSSISLIKEDNSISDKKLNIERRSVERCQNLSPLKKECVTTGRVKPPLLPKPAPGCSSFPLSPKPPIPKRPVINPLTRRSILNSSAQTSAFRKHDVGPVSVDKSISKSVKSNVLSFENVVGKGCCENPVRPPRSPKNKPFPGMPFDFISGQQIVSSRQKNLSLPLEARQNPSILAFWNCHSGVVCNKEELISQEPVKGKSYSLERNVALISCEHFSLGSGNLGVEVKFPIPPPRKGKKKSPDVGGNFFPGLSPPGNVVPVYAVVNYELKKNRRLQINNNNDARDVIVNQDDSNPVSVDDSTPTESSLKGEVNNVCILESGNVGAAIDEVEKRFCDTSKESDVSNCENQMKYCKSCGGSAVDVIKDINDEDEELTNISPLEESCDIGKSFLVHEESILPLENETEEIIVEVSQHFNEYVKGECEKVSLVAEDHLNQEGVRDFQVFKQGTEDSINDCSQTMEMDHQPDKSNPQSELCDVSPAGISDEKNGVSSLFNIDKADDTAKNKNDKTDNMTKINVSLDKDNIDSKNTTDSLDLNQCICKMHQFPLECNDQCKDFAGKTPDCDVCPSSNILEIKSQSVGENLGFKLSQTSSLPLRSKLGADHGRNNDSSRRQSWSDGQKKEVTKSNNTDTNKERRKRKGNSLWCDEGELSSGTLGDQSSFEDVPVEEIEASPVRRRLSAIFSSFGKSTKKPQKQKEKKQGKVITKFYYASQNNEKQTKQENVAAIDEDSCVNVDSSILLPSCKTENESLEESDTTRVILEDGVSDLCMKVDSIDMERKSSEFGSGSHLSEESFENVHSESENEETTHTEDKLDTSLSESQQRDKKAFYIAQELMTSENVFVDALRLLSIDFPNAVTMAGAEQKNEIIPEADLCKILNNLPQLLRFNEDLLHDLESRIHNWNSCQKIADIIVRKGPFLKLYTSYFQNFETQCHYLDEYCESNPRFAKVVRDFEASPRCHKLALKHYMLKPIQRLPQYRLLLEDYLAHLEPHSADFEDTQVALSIVCDVADHANRSMKQGDTLSKLLQLQSRLKNYGIIKPGRTFLKEGELQKLCRKGMQSRYFILLNDCLLYAAYDRSVQAPGSLKVNNELPLNGMKVEIPVAEDYTNEFSIISTTRSFTLSASSSQERSEWVNALSRAIQDNTSRQLSFLQMKLAQDNSNEKGNVLFQLGMAAPVWIQDCRVTMCQCCTAEFTVTFRRHHCRACGKVVCGSCSANKAPLQYMKYQTARVCDECYDSLLKEFDENLKNMKEAIQHEICSSDYAGTVEALETIRATFKKYGPTTGRKTKKYIPQRLKEVCANDTGSQMSGWLHWRCRKSWKKMWFVLKEQVLYVYKASEDVVALESIPILGYQVLIPTELENLKSDGMDTGTTFSLTHKGKYYLEFQADSVQSSKRWIHAMQEATVLK